MDGALVRHADPVGPVQVDVTPFNAGWGWTGLRVIELSPGGTVSLESQGNELIVLPLTGSADLTCGDDQAHLEGRSSVFEAVSDFAYVGRDREISISSAAGGRFALPAARSGRELPFRYVPASAVPVEPGGGGSSSGRYSCLCTPGPCEADRLLVREALVPVSNGPFHPPTEGDEMRRWSAECEEIDYFEIAHGPTGPGVAHPRVIGPGERPIVIDAEVRTGDVVLIPRGWHSPSVTASGGALYRLTVMADSGAAMGAVIG